MAKAKAKRAAGQKLWQGRLQGGTDPWFERMSFSTHYDCALVHDDLAVGQAHVRMLQRIGLLTKSEAGRIARTLGKMANELHTGKLQPDLSLEDIHTWVEQELTRRLGKLGGKLHTGRSRNDLVVTDLRRYLRTATTALDRLLRDLCAALVTQAAAHTGTVMAGYTHGQPAQPVTVAHYLLAFAEMFDRDRQRLRDLMPRLNRCPLGSGALAGSTLPLDRAFTAKELGFDSPTDNSMDAVSDRDFVLDFLHAGALIGLHLSRWAAEWIEWHRPELNFVHIPDAYCTGSSLMPQKRNPDALELIRGKAGRLLGNYQSLAIVLKGLPLTYYRDLQEDKEPLFDSIEQLVPMLNVAARIVTGTTFNAAALAQASANTFLLATDVVEQQVRRGMPFRAAYRAMGEEVARAVAAGKPLAVPHDAAASVNLRRTHGGPAAREVRKQLAAWRRRLKR
ncbi:MAG TPA: argininosuccinate lyase [bacterium]|nr:argininosuccinate lyase [bacterium]